MPSAVISDQDVFCDSKPELLISNIKSSSPLGLNFLVEIKLVNQDYNFQSRVPEAE